MLILDLAGDHAEGPVGDVPGEGAPELSRIEGRRPSIDCRNRRFSLLAIALIDVDAEPVDLPYYVRDASTGSTAASVEDQPKIVLVTSPPVP